MKKPKRAGARTSTLSESELLAQWAAEEFVAAGRARMAEERRAHRQRAIFFREVLGGLQTSAPPSNDPEARNADLASLLNLAFRPDHDRSLPTAVPIDRDPGTPPAPVHPSSGNGRGAPCTDYLNRTDDLQPDNRPASRQPSER